MVKIKEAIVVEGRYDKNTLSQIVDAPILETSGFGIMKDKQQLKLLRRVAQSRGLIVFTDSDISPLAEFATYLLIAQSDMASFMDSLVAPISIINAIVVEITNRKEREITERFDKLEALWDEYDVYTKR